MALELCVRSVLRVRASGSVVLRLLTTARFDSVLQSLYLMVIFPSFIDVLVSFGLVSMYILLHFVHNGLRPKKKMNFAAWCIL
jgi:hypothetical protein